MDHVEGEQCSEIYALIERLSVQENLRLYIQELIGELAARYIERYKVSCSGNSGKYIQLISMWINCPRPSPRARTRWRRICARPIADAKSHLDRTSCARPSEKSCFLF